MRKFFKVGSRNVQGTFSVLSTRAGGRGADIAGVMEKEFYRCITILFDQSALLCGNTNVLPSLKLISGNKWNKGHAIKCHIQLQKNKQTVLSVQ